LAFGKGSASWIWQQSVNTQARPWDNDLLNPKSTGFNTIVEDYYCAKFQVIPIRGFPFIMLTYPSTYTHTLWRSDCYNRAAILRRRGQ